MLQSSDSTTQLRKWLDRLGPLSEAARGMLSGVAPEKVAMRTGCRLDAEGNYGLTFFLETYVISADTFTVRRANAVRRANSGDEVLSFTESLILTYMVTADGTTPSGRWIGFRELPDGMFYAQAFQGYSGGRLVREFGTLAVSVADALRRAAPTQNGEPIQIGDAGFAFTVLPRIRMAVVLWEGDDEFPSQARVLFEDTACHYMPTDGLAILGSQLVGRLLRAAQPAS